jgi:5'-3' exonuclease
MEKEALDKTEKSEKLETSEAKSEDKASEESQADVPKETKVESKGLKPDAINKSGGDSIQDESVISELKESISKLEAKVDTLINSLGNKSDDDIKNNDPSKSEKSEDEILTKDVEQEKEEPVKPDPTTRRHIPKDGEVKEDFFLRAKNGDKNFDGAVWAATYEDELRRLVPKSFTHESWSSK